MPQRATTAKGHRLVCEDGGNGPPIEKEGAYASRSETVRFLRGITRQVRRSSGDSVSVLGDRVICGPPMLLEEAMRGLTKRPILANCYLQGNVNDGPLFSIRVRAKSPTSSRRRTATSS